MEKVYLLLRKNQQTGPYTYEELLQQQLTSSDLIWVEGKSTTWLNPSELDTFNTKTKKSNPEAVNRVNKIAAPRKPSSEIPWYQQHRSPEAELEERARASRERANAAASHSHHPAPTTRTHRHKHMVYQEEESPILLEVHTLHKKNVSLPQLIAAGVITALVATGWYNREMLNIVRSQPAEVSQAASPVTFQVILPTPAKPSSIPVSNTVTALMKDTVHSANSAAPAMAVYQAKPVKIAVKEAVVQEPEAKPALAQSTTAEKKEEGITDTAAATAKAEKKESVDTTMKQAENNNTAIVQETPHKKKGLGQAIKNIFKKKKKDNEEEAEKASVE